MGLAQCLGYIGASLWIIISTIVGVFVLIYYHPYMNTLLFAQGSCIIYDSIYTTQFACDCGTGCRTTYPCLIIYAHLNGSDLTQEAQEWPVILYVDDWQYIKVRNTDPELREQVSISGILCICMSSVRPPVRFFARPSAFL